MQGSTLLLPSAVGHPSAMVAQALTIYKNLVGSSSDICQRASQHVESSEDNKGQSTSSFDLGANEEMVFSLQNPTKKIKS